MEKIDHLTVSRIGKMQAWHKYITFMGVILTLVSGITWFISDDLLEKDIADLRFWIFFHGIAGHIFFIILGMAFYHHIQVCFKMKKNLFLGCTFLLSSILLMASILALYYGRGVIQEHAHVVHIFAGSLVGLVFFLHIQIGKKSLAIGIGAMTKKQSA